MKVAALTARTTHCLTNSFQTNQLGALPVSALQLRVPPSVKSQPQATPVDDGSFLLTLCFLGMGWFGFLLPVQLLSVDLVVLQYPIVTVSHRGLL